MLELGPSGSVRGVLGNEHPYREPASILVAQVGSDTMIFYDVT